MRIEPSTAVPSLLIRVMDFAFFAAEDSGSCIVIYGGSQSSFLLLDCLCLAGTSPRGPWNAEVVHAKLLEARSRQRTRVVDALKKEIDLMKNEKEFLLPPSSLIIGNSSFKC